jgi:hypothetical protein
VIMALLDPVASAQVRSAATFEGSLLEARDAKGPFVGVRNTYRGEVMGGQWSWSPCWYPYEHSQLGQKPCPPGSTG